jgi:NADH-quinone oxidoreductase subunit C
MSAEGPGVGSRPLKLLLESFPAEVLHHHEEHGDATAVIRRERMLDVFRHLRRDPSLSFEFLMDECGVDRLLLADRFERYEVVCHLYSLTHNHRLRIRVPVPEEDPVVDSLTAVWRSANWFEREIWDMYGIRFRGHPDLRRLLLYDQFEGHPLRKNYPITKRQPLVGPLN